MSRLLSCCPVFFSLFFVFDLFVCLFVCCFYVLFCFFFFLIFFFFFFLGGGGGGGGLKCPTWTVTVSSAVVQVRVTQALDYSQLDYM